METKDLNQLLDSVYELEGLLHLALSRDELPASLPRLIRNKALAVAALAADIPDDRPAPAKYEEAAPAEYEEPSEAIVEQVPEPSEAVVEHAPEPSEAIVEHAPEPLEAARVHAPSFSLNDRFLFIRELFGNDSALFDKAMRTLPGFDSYEEAEVYFYDELGLESDNRQVIRFMAVISNYFRSR